MDVTIAVRKNTLVDIASLSKLKEMLQPLLTRRLKVKRIGMLMHLMQLRIVSYAVKEPGENNQREITTSCMMEAEKEKQEDKGESEEGKAPEFVIEDESSQSEKYRPRYGNVALQNEKELIKNGECQWKKKHKRYKKKKET